MTVALNTLAYARRLREAGFSEQQAEGQAEALAAAMSDSIATKEDLHALGGRMDALEARMDARFTRFETHMNARFQAVSYDLRELETRMNARLDVRLADLERRITLRLGGMIVASIGAASAFARLL